MRKVGLIILGVFLAVCLLASAGLNVVSGALGSAFNGARVNIAKAVAPDGMVVDTSRNSGGEVAATQQSTQEVDDSKCPTRREVNDLMFGKQADGSSYDRVVEVSEEDGAWAVNTGKPEFHYSVNLPAGTVTTLHRPEADLAEVYDNLNGQVKDPLEMFRMTVRFRECYSHSDDMWASNAAERILVKENTNGTYQKWYDGRRVQDWQFAVIAGNFDCDVCPAAHVANNAVENRTTAVPTSCPTFGGQNTAPGNDGAGYCKYSGAVVTDMVPAGFSAQYWTGSDVANANAGDSITTGEATFRKLP